MYIPDIGLIDPQVILDHPGTIPIQKNRQIIRTMKDQPVLIALPKYFKLEFSVKLNNEPENNDGWRNILHG